MVLIIGAGFLVYANALQGDFLWDDETLVEFNPYIKDWAQLGKIFTSRLGSIANEAGAFYRPVQTFTYLLDYSFWRLNVVGYHLSNTVWHILTAVGVFALLQRFFGRGILSLLTALLFVVHPIHTEAVAYISGRADSLATCFMLFSFVLYLRSAARPGIGVLGGMTVCFMMALLSKEISFILPVLILFYHYSFRKPIFKKAFFILIGTLVLFALWRFFVIGTSAIAEGETPTLAERLPGIFVALTNYYRILLLPFGLHMEYGGLLFPYGEPKAFAGLFLSALIAVYVWVRRKRDPFLLFAAGWFFIALLPSSNLFIPINAYMAEHWLYIPSIGFFMLLARFLANLYESKKLRGVAILTGIGMLGFYAALTVLQNRHWNNDISFYKKMLLHAPASSRLYNNLAKAYHDAGRDKELIDLLKSALALDPNNILAYNNLGNAYKEAGNYAEAKRCYLKAIEMDPTHAGPYYNLSTIYADVDNNVAGAIELLNKALELSPYFSKTYNKLGQIYLQQGEHDKAIELLKTAVKLNPDDPEIYHNFGYVYMQSGFPDKGEEMYLKAIEIAPNYAPVYHDLAVIYTQSGDYAKAILYCDRAVSMGYVDQQLLGILKPYR
ncbi:MAG: hypothetical protein A3C36_03140 [Omnitrophica WOR_2 bacterium RIFCSPHIGHO2_02_FULL_52_10]|nr:MAG: hypothetical protein A3C36_03140 [Omnitrophica WOR_2 bacterium RIFCSPHIGHO2_02_FULL_52_10]